MKCLVTVIVILLSGCAGNLKERAAFYSELTPNDRSKKIYKSAKTCWSKDANLVQKGIVVESRVDIDSIKIEARLDEFTSSKLKEPLLVISIREHNNGSLASVSARWPFLEYEKDAKRWSRGDFKC